MVQFGDPAVRTATHSMLDLLQKSGGAAAKADENVRVVVRVRPLMEWEERKGCVSSVDVKEDRNEVCVFVGSRV